MDFSCLIQMMCLHYIHMHLDQMNSQELQLYDPRVFLSSHVHCAPHGYDYSYYDVRNHEFTVFLWLHVISASKDLTQVM